MVKNQSLDFGAVHGLAHYVVETSLGLSGGFLGLLAQGRHIQDFEAKGAATVLSDEAIVAECIVGQLTNSLFGSQSVSPEDFNWLVAQAVTGVRPGAKAQSIDTETFERMRQQLAGLLAQWQALPPGQALALEFSLS